MGDERIGSAVPDLDRLIDESVGLGGLLGDGVDGVLENVSLSARHEAMLGGACDVTCRSEPGARNEPNEVDLPCEVAGRAQLSLLVGGKGGEGQ